VQESIIQALKNSLEASIDRHKVNVSILMSNNVGVAEHPDLLQTIEDELEKIAQYKDKLEALSEFISD
jgi:hypothetical protein